MAVSDIAGEPRTLCGFPDVASRLVLVLERRYDRDGRLRTCPPSACRPLYPPCPAQLGFPSPFLFVPSAHANRSVCRMYAPVGIITQSLLIRSNPPIKPRSTLLCLFTTTVCLRAQRPRSNKEVFPGKSARTVLLPFVHKLGLDDLTGRGFAS